MQSQREEVHKNKLVFKITYYPIFSKFYIQIFIENSPSFNTAQGTQKIF